MDESGDKSMPHFYAPIKKWQTRLLRLHPGDERDILRADLLIADIVQLAGLVLHDDQVIVDYDAISYAWGNLKLNKLAIINGRKAWITTSLGEALECFRYRDKDHLLWADALCINQNDNWEKNEQIQSMLEIYRRARSVLVWLGPSNELTSVATSYLNGRGRTRRGSLFGDNEATINEVKGKPYQGMLDLCCRPWTLRAWIQQEVFAAHAVTIFCGTYQMSLDALKFAGDRIHELQGSHEEIKFLTEEQKVCCKLIRNLRQSTATERAKLRARRLEKQLPICASLGVAKCTRPECILGTTCGVLCRDPRDRVYALLSLMDCRTISDRRVVLRPDEPILPVDYNRLSSQVFQDLTRYIINRDHSLNVLLRHPGTGPMKNDLGLPSWTPDWRYWEGRCHIDSHDDVEYLEPMWSELPWQHDNPNGTLDFYGFVWGSVVENGTPRSSNIASSRPNLEFKRRIPAEIFELAPREDSFQTWLSHWKISDVLVGDVLVQVPNTDYPLFLRPRADGGYFFLGSHVFHSMREVVMAVVQWLQPQGFEQIQHFKVY